MPQPQKLLRFNTDFLNLKIGLILKTLVGTYLPLAVCSVVLYGMTFAMNKLVKLSLHIYCQNALLGR